MLCFKNIIKNYPSRSGNELAVALDDVSFEVKEKEFVSIVGKSGAGKTTLLRLAIAQESPTTGQVFFQGRDVHKIKKSQIPKLRQRIGVVFQDYKLFASKNTFENVAYIMEITGAEDKEIKRDVPQILNIVGLSSRERNFPNELSGGEKQRLAIARALIHRPEIILADEPTGNLDPYNTFGIIRLLVKIYESGTTVVLATHDREVINTLGKRVITLDGGKVVRDEERGRFVL
ncbi:MAG: cell division ATP-binding protein FtsE [Candidatus Nealsonbacteria bacterium RIFCSPHIGHO2_01_FULL_38_55]|uniref:Cell division ATP-binding protein FtsE n=2 Tax=Candidatus Nealsoniibacteriota TaxID=1817911 RepID=A0A1G2EJ49_9BACT|nr:MAG: Cell division ATP-binding protein FtsE [Parcubacteria group bacterium GW2011_GWA2_38_27]KKQ97061.1 MAG: Cell division ATP-binding protein FtsE [Parcubacteria group bacterium GW2011_GWC2_39_11]OGZ19616.1 MAG: cell division ATP-binding protein FtsE [Candidatus Nealsonbacteria bacterium RIFCSPHIGHO2_01_FULL_38_55]OGZ20845.1 MAG: cell division ATP-binding protein FtsE [Candidatus Nealsonbacteria bacterium RIFCSPHIGHO2_02_FULL_38_75]OGZ22702.1 MAG: cell division ATP-binding protein FtsE [Can